MLIDTISFEIHNFDTHVSEKFLVANTLENQEKIFTHRYTRNIEFGKTFSFQFEKEMAMPIEFIEMSTWMLMLNSELVKSYDESIYHEAMNELNTAVAEYEMEEYKTEMKEYDDVVNVMSEKEGPETVQCNCENSVCTHTLNEQQCTNHVLTGVNCVAWIGEVCSECVVNYPNNLMVA